MRNKSVPHAAFAAVLLTASVALPATGAHYTFAEVNSVDTSTRPGEIRWRDGTQWDDARQWAISKWQTARGSKVTWAADTATTIEDLEFVDYSANDGKCGWWIPNPGSDNIRFNNSAFSGYTTTKRRACATHEAGHALALGDHGEAEWNSKAIMDSCPVCSGTNDSLFTTPQSHDLADFDGKWK